MSIFVFFCPLMKLPYKNRETRKAAHKVRTKGMRTVNSTNLLQNTRRWASTPLEPALEAIKWWIALWDNNLAKRQIPDR